MNTLTTNLQTRLKTDGRITGLVGQRVHAEAQPVELTTPYLTIVSSVNERLKDLTGIGGTAQSTVTVTAWEGLGGDLEALTQAVVDVLDNLFSVTVGTTRIQCTTFLERTEVQGPLPHVGPVPVEGVSMTFDCWHEE